LEVKRASTLKAEGNTSGRNGHGYVEEFNPLEQEAGGK